MIKKSGLKCAEKKKLNCLDKDRHLVLAKVAKQLIERLDILQR